MVLVGHDWGGALAFDWAARHPERVRGIAFFETIVKPLSWDEYPPVAQERFKGFRAPGVGERKILEENIFITEALHATTLTELSEADYAVYAAPYPTVESRRPLLAWPRATPIDGEPADVVARVEAYDAYLASDPRPEAAADIRRLADADDQAGADGVVRGEHGRAGGRRTAGRPATSRSRTSPRRSAMRSSPGSAERSARPVGEASRRSAGDLAHGLDDAASRRTRPR